METKDREMTSHPTANVVLVGLTALAEVWGVTGVGYVSMNCLCLFRVRTINNEN
jgi:hypothetical protein